MLTHSDEQLATARVIAERLEVTRGRKLATRVEPIKRFTNAEEYHQKYSLRNSRVLMADFRAMFGSDEDALRESTAAARVNGYVAGDGSGTQLEREIDGFGLTRSGRAELAARFGRRSGGIGCSI